MSKEIWMVKGEDGKFMPLNNRDKEIADKIPVMDDTCFTIKKVRNPKFHRKYFAMLQMAFDNQDEFEDFEIFRKLMEMRAGHHVMVNTGKTTIPFHQSVAYDKLDQDDFEKLYKRVWDVLEYHYGFDNELFEAELIGFA